MSTFNKVTYIENSTVIHAENLNDIQDAIISNEDAIEETNTALSGLDARSVQKVEQTFTSAEQLQIAKNLGLVYTAGDIINIVYGFGYSHYAGDTLQLFFPTARPIIANGVTLTSVANFAVRGSETTPVISQTNDLSPYTVACYISNAANETYQGIRMQITNISTNGNRALSVVGTMKFTLT